MNSIPTQSATPARLLRWAADAAAGWALRRWLRAAQADAIAWKEQATYCQARALRAERLASRLQSRVDTI